jgi:hypothetical protein
MVMERNTAPNTNDRTAKEASMNFVTDILSVHTTDEAAQNTPKRYTLELDGVHSWVWVVAFDVETKTGLALSDTTNRIFSFRITGRGIARNGMVRVACYALEDVSLSAGQLTSRNSEKMNGGYIASQFITDPEAAAWNLV